jgi:hypothetical protein
MKCKDDSVQLAGLWKGAVIISCKALCQNLPWEDEEKYKKKNTPRVASKLEIFKPGTSWMYIQYAVATVTHSEYLPLFYTVSNKMN